jgi:hypothetical protein
MLQILRPPSRLQRYRRRRTQWPPNLRQQNPSRWNLLEPKLWQRFRPRLNQLRRFRRVLAQKRRFQRELVRRRHWLPMRRLPNPYAMPRALSSQLPGF